MTEAEHQALTVDCVDCRGELPSDRNLLAYLIGRVGTTYQEVERAFLAKESGPLQAKSVEQEKKT